LKIKESPQDAVGNFLAGLRRSKCTEVSGRRSGGRRVKAGDRLLFPADADLVLLNDPVMLFQRLLFEQGHDAVYSIEHAQSSPLYYSVFCDIFKVNSAMTARQEHPA
jgi:hypothetical protein